MVSEASNPSKVKVFGPALEKPVKTFQPTYLIVDCSQAGPGEHGGHLRILYMFSDRTDVKFIIINSKSDFRIEL